MQLFTCLFLFLVSFDFFFGSLNVMANEVESPSLGLGSNPSSFDVIQVFQGCPVVYVFLILLSVVAFTIWLYSLLTLRLSRMMPEQFINDVRECLMEKKFEAALVICLSHGNFVSTIVASGIAARKHGPHIVMGIMQAEGRRAGHGLWQRISLLNEIAVLAPMLGLLGTVIGLFFAFYDSKRSTESIAAIFDGLGIAVGTTVVGLIVAILAMIFHTTLKYRVVNLLNTIENESLSLANLVEIDSNEQCINSKNNVLLS